MHVPYPFMGSDAQTFRNTAKLVVTNEVTAYNTICREVYSKLLPDWLGFNLRCFVSCVHSATAYVSRCWLNSNAHRITHTFERFIDIEYLSNTVHLLEVYFRQRQMLRFFHNENN